MWHGRICSPDGALQILLIIDYIFDWARDLYRPSVFRSLEAIANPNTDDTASVATDSDIYSCKRFARGDDITAAESDFGFDNLETSTNDESLLEPWKKYDTLSTRGICFSDLRAFRPSYIVESAFECLNITGDNIGTLIASLGGKPQHLMRMARDALAALRIGPMILTERILSQIEDTWTGTPRTNCHAGISRKKFCSIVYRASISDSWELKRTIVCFAVDQDALDIIRRHASLQRKTFRLDGMEDTAKIVDENTVTKILQSLKNRDHKDIFSNAVSEIHDIWKPVNQLTKEEYREAASIVNEGIVLKPQTWGGRAIQHIVCETYNRHKQPGLLRPDFPYLRFSARLEQLDTNAAANEAPVLSLGVGEQAAQVASESSYLVCDENRNGNQLCVFTTAVYQSPPTIQDVTLMLVSACTKKRFLILNRIQSLRTERPKLVSVPVVERNEILVKIIRNAGYKWLLDLLNRFNEALFTDLASILNVSTHSDVLDKLSSMSEGLQMYDRNRPFDPYSYESPRAKKERIVPIERSPGRMRAGTPPSPLEYTKEMEINDILAQANGDALTDDQINVLTQLGHFT